MQYRARNILDVGCGKEPWHIRRQRMEEGYGGLFGDLATPLMKQFTTFEPGDAYVCIDPCEEHIQEAMEQTDRLKHTRDGFKGDINYLVCDGTSLPVHEGMADAVILSDVLSAPEVRGDGVNGVDKIRILDEALRVLNPEGSLVVAIYTNPHQAKEAMDYVRCLRSLGRIKLATQYGYYMPRCEDWTLYEAEYRKAEGFRGVTRLVPLTAAQRQYAESHLAHRLLC